ncbi:MAG: hypothetical protein ACXACI_14295 [Candidatus Hodarchaeales archaeon]|jgi:hypothetical protein
MTRRPKYWQPTIKPSFKEEIENLFKRSEKTKNFYGNNPVAFVEDAIRRLILFYEDKEE